MLVAVTEKEADDPTVTMRGRGWTVMEVVGLKVAVGRPANDEDQPVLPWM